jgi:hypothetical protein
VKGGIRARSRLPAHSLSEITEAGSYLRLVDSCITQLNAEGPSRTCDESKEEEEVFREGTRDTVLDNPLTTKRNTLIWYGLLPESRGLTVLGGTFSGQRMEGHPGDNPGANRWFL